MDAKRVDPVLRCKCRHRLLYFVIPCGHVRVKAYVTASSRRWLELLLKWRHQASFVPSSKVNFQKNFLYEVNKPVLRFFDIKLLTYSCCSTDQSCSCSAVKIVDCFHTGWRWIVIRPRETVEIGWQIDSTRKHQSTFRIYCCHAARNRQISS